MSPGVRMNPAEKNKSWSRMNPGARMNPGEKTNSGARLKPRARMIRGIEKMLRTVNRICSGMDMKLAVEKMGFLTNDPGQTTWKEDTDGLGSVSVAQNYSNAAIALSRNGLDRALAAHTLWERCAVPAVLYATEAMVLSKGVLEKLDRIQHIVSRYILKLQKSSARVAGALDAGLMPMKERVSIKLGNYV